MSCTDDPIHTAKHSINEMQNLASARTIATLRNEHKEALIYLENIIEKETYSERPMRVVNTEQH